MYYYKYKTMVGEIFLISNDEHLLELTFSKPNSLILKETKIIKEAYKQISEYFAKQRTIFNLPLLIEGSDFECDVYASLSNINYGNVMSYKELALSVSRDKAYRAVGSACGKNKFPIIIPCHRVIKSDASLGGFALDIKIKKFLLEHEGHLINDGSIVITSNCQ